MKKPNLRVKRGEIIPKGVQKKTSSKKESDTNINFDELLGKLNGQQLLELGNSIVGLGCNGFDYLKEKEVTARVHAEVSLGIEKVNADRARVLTEHETKRAEIDAFDKKDIRRHKEDMREITNSHQQMMNILNQVDEGKIPPAVLVDLISKVKGEN